MDHDDMMLGCFFHENGAGVYFEMAYMAYFIKLKYFFLNFVLRRLTDIGYCSDFSICGSR